MEIEIATKKSLENRKKRREERLLTLLGYIKINPKQTVYSLHKHFNWPIGSIHSLIKELKEDGHLRYETIEENNRLKKIYSITTLDDYIRNYFNHQTLLVPVNLRSARNALSKKHSIKIELKDKIIDVTPDMDLDEVIKKYNIVLDLED